MSELQKFIFEGGLVRGAIVRLDDAWVDLLARRGPAGSDHHWPAPVAELLGQMCAAATLLQSAIRFDGSLSLQIAGDGPVRLAVAEVQPDYRFRATATLGGDSGSGQATGDGLAEGPGATGFEQLINRSGRGRFALTLQPGSGERQTYQSQVPLADEHGAPLPGVASAVEAYLRASEQIDACMILAADGQAAAGLMLQRLPGEGGRLSAGSLATPEETTAQARAQLEHLTLLARSITADELLQLDVSKVLHRLFWQDGLQVMETRAGPQAPRFVCTCDAQRVARMLRSLGRDEARSIIAEQGRIEVACEFCGQAYRFDAVEAEQLFTAAIDAPPVTGGIH